MPAANWGIWGGGGGKYFFFGAEMSTKILSPNRALDYDFLVTFGVTFNFSGFRRFWEVSIFLSLWLKSLIQIGKGAAKHLD